MLSPVNTVCPDFFGIVLKIQCLHSLPGNGIAAGAENRGADLPVYQPREVLSFQLQAVLSSASDPGLCQISERATGAARTAEGEIRKIKAGWKSRDLRDPGIRVYSGSFPR